MEREGDAFVLLGCRDWDLIDSIGRFGSTDASVSLVSITVGITVEHP